MISYIYVARVTINDIAHHPYTFFQIDQRKHVGDFVPKERGRRPMYYRKRVHNAAAAALAPFEAFGKTMRTYEPWIKSELIAIEALLKHKLVTSSSVPVFLRVPIGLRQRTFIYRHC